MRGVTGSSRRPDGRLRARGRGRLRGHRPRGHRRAGDGLAADGRRGLEDLLGRGVYYGAGRSEAKQCGDDPVVVVGAGNSAGQAVMNLADAEARRDDARPRRPAAEVDVGVPRAADRGAPADRRPVPHARSRASSADDGGTSTASPSPAASGSRRARSSSASAACRGPGGRPATACALDAARLRPHRARPARRRAPPRGLAARARPAGARDERARAVRRGRRAQRLDEARRRARSATARWPRRSCTAASRSSRAAHRLTRDLVGKPERRHRARSGRRSRTGPGRTSSPGGRAGGSPSPGRSSRRARRSRPPRRSTPRAAGSAPPPTTGRGAPSWGTACRRSPR